MSNRVEYIDALRGFTMILVVLGHVEFFSFYVFSYTSTIMSLIYSFHMPLFFFISGYILSLNESTKKGVKILKQVKSKTLVLLFPTLFFGLTYTYLLLGDDVKDFIYNSEKLGYWFTISLLEMFLIYYLVLLLVKRNEKSILIVLSVLAIVMYGLKLPFKVNDTLNMIGNITCFHNTFNYFQYFVFGFIAYKLNLMQRIKTNKYLLLMMILSFCGLFYIYYYVIGIDSSVLGIGKLTNDLIALILGYIGVVIAFLSFDKYKDVFSDNRKLGRILQFIGKRTLDIYLLHYFLLPYLPQFGDFFKAQPNFIIELFIGLVVAIVVTGVALLISNVFRISEMLGKFLFGVKQRNGQS